MYLKVDGTPIAETGAANGLQSWTDVTDQTVSGTPLNDVLQGARNSILVGGAGDDWYYPKGPGIQLVETPGGGVDSVTTWMNFRLPANVENLFLAGDGLYAAGNGLDNLIKVGDTNAMTLYGAGGSNVLVGGAGTDTFVVDAAAGANAIYGWHGGDRIRLLGGSMQSFADIQAAMVQQGADVMFRNGLNTVVVRNASISQFTAADFDLPLSLGRVGRQTFSEDFDSLNLRSASNPTGRWATNYGYGGLGSYTLPGNGELQIYTAPGFTGTAGRDLGLNPFSTAGGVLDIHAQWVDPAVSADIWNYGYTSGVLTTKASFSQTYGYFEMRAELPANGGGAWPAFWLVPADGSWPPELDVLEQLSGDPSVVYTTAHSNTGGVHTRAGAANFMSEPDGFHTYGVLWSPSDLVWYVDGVQVFKAPTPADMHKPMYMIVNLAVGGWAGTPSFTSADLKVDYVRAYALAPSSTAPAAALASFHDLIDPSHAGVAPPSDWIQF